MELSPVLNLDIGGKRFRVLRSTVMKYPNSLVARVITGKDVDHMIIFDGAYFFDRNPHYFSAILDYMRMGQLYIPQFLLLDQLKEELKFWKIEGALNNLVVYPNQISGNQSINLVQQEVHIHQLQHPKDEDYQEPTLVIPDYIESTLLMQNNPEPTMIILSPKIEPTQLIENFPSFELLATQSIEIPQVPESKKPSEKIDQVVLTKSIKLKEESYNPEEDDLLCSLVQDKPESKPLKTQSRTLPWAKSVESKPKPEETIKEKKEPKLENKKPEKDLKKRDPRSKLKPRKSNKKSESDSYESSFIEKSSDSEAPSQPNPPNKRKNVKSEVKKVVKKQKFKKSDLVSEEELIKALRNSG